MSTTEAAVERRAATHVRPAGNTQGYISDLGLIFGQNSLTVKKNLTAATFNFLAPNRVTALSLRSQTPKQLVLIHPTS